MMQNKETTDLLEKLVAIPSPYFEESEIMTFAKEWFEANQITVKEHKYVEDKITGFNGTNLIIEINGGKKGPTIHLNGHLDTVKLCNGWRKKPYGEIDGDRLYGTGALDMKSGCAAIMVAVKDFVEKNAVFNGKILVSLVSVEEGPYGMGTNALIEDGYLKDVDFSIITEPSAGFSGKPFPDLCLGARGGYGLSINFYGKSAHAACPEKGISALTDAAKVIEQIEQMEYIKDPHLGQGVCSVVSINADGGACSIPDFATIKLFWHIVVGENQQSIKKQLEKAIKEAKINSRFDIVFRDAPSEGSRGFLPFTVEKDNEFVSEFIDSIKDVTEVEPSISYFSSIGDFCYLGTRIDAPAIIFGAEGNNFHSEDEYVTLDSVHKTSLVLENFLNKMLL